jgi:gamma-glutamylcyclotransferase
MIYFAYGSNMNHRQMRKRCPSSLFINAAYIEGYKYVYDGYSKNWKGAVANIISGNKDIVWGGLFEINSDNLAALDCYENYPKTYNRKMVKVTDINGKTVDAIIYVRSRPKDIGKPSEDYRSVVVTGARDCGITDDYIKKYLL